MEIQSFVIGFEIGEKAIQSCSCDTYFDISPPGFLR